MAIFLGCCVIAAMLWYVGKKIARALVAISVMLENIGARQYDNWPDESGWRRAFRDFTE